MLETFLEKHGSHRLEVLAWHCFYSVVDMVHIVPYLPGGGFWRRRIIKVYVPYVIIEMIVGVVLGRDVLSVLFGLTLIRICHPYGWYLQWLFAWYLLAYVMIRFVKNQRVVTICLIGISIVCLIFHTNLRAEQAFSFSSGMILAMNRVYIKQIEDQQKKLLGIIFLVIGVGMFGFRQTAYVRVEHMELYKYINLVMKLSLAYSILIGVYFVCIGNKVWKWVGKYAYALYLLHAYFIFIISNNLCGNFILNTAIFLAISFLAAIGMIKLIDKFDYLLKYYLVT